MALDAFLEIRNGNQPAIQGEAQDKVFGAKHRAAMALISFDLNSEQKGEESFTFKITKDIDLATPELFLAFCQHWASTRSPSTEGKTHGIFQQAKVTIRKVARGSQPIEYLVFEFGEVWVRQWELKNSDGDSLPEEEVTFCFNSGCMRYYPQRDDGSRGTPLIGEWNFRQNA